MFIGACSRAKLIFKHLLSIRMLFPEKKFRLNPKADVETLCLLLQKKSTGGLPVMSFRQFPDIVFGDLFERQTEFVGAGRDVPEHVAEFVL